MKFRNEHDVYRLKKALNRLKQTPQAWYRQIEAQFWKDSFKKCPHEHTLFVKIRDGGKGLILCLYVDDRIFIENEVRCLINLKVHDDRI